MKNMMHGKTLKIEEGEHKGGEGRGALNFIFVSVSIMVHVLINH